MSDTTQMRLDALERTVAELKTWCRALEKRCETLEAGHRRARRTLPVNVYNQKPKD